MPAALPFILAGSAAATGAATIKGTQDARKGQKEQLEQTDRIAAETRANQGQGERAAEDVFTKRRSRRTPGFTDAGAASLGSAGTSAAYLGA